MKNLTTVLIAIIAVIAVVGIGSIGAYNGLVSKKEEVDSKLSNIDTQLERRADLIQNLVNTVKGSSKHEKDVIESVTSARTKLKNASTIAEKANANEELSKSLGEFNVIIENYPDLKATQNFIQLSDELAGTENRIANARREYNEAVKNYNKSIKSFPNSLLASMFKFEEAEYFEVSEGKAEVPDVNFD